MVQTRKGWIGVDLGATAVKLAQLECDAAGVRLCASAVVQRDAVATAAEGGDHPLHPLWTSREIRAALALEPRFRGRTSACVLSLNHTGVRMLSLPPGSDAERRSMIANQLLDAVGASIADCEFDYWLAGEDAAEEDTVGAVYLPRRTATDTARRISQTGLNCEVLDGLPLVLARAVQWFVAEGETAAVVDWGRTQALLAVVRDGRPLFARVLRDCGYQRMLDAVADRLELSHHDVQRLLSLYGVAGPAVTADGDEAELALLLSQFVAEPLLAMEQELARTLNHLQLHRQRMLPHRIFLCGGGATIRRIDALLSIRLDLPVEAWRLSRGITAECAVPFETEPLLAGAAALSALAWTT